MGLSFSGLKKAQVTKESPATELRFLRTSVGIPAPRPAPATSGDRGGRGVSGVWEGRLIACLSAKGSSLVVRLPFRADFSFSGTTPWTV